MQNYKFILLTAATFIFNNLHSVPKGPQIIGGKGAVFTSDKSITVKQSTDRAIVNWKSFSVSNGETVNFVQPSSSSVILNRVVGSASSLINGNINANGHVYLINPNGVSIGPNGVIKTNSFLGSTLNMENDRFLADNDFVFTGENQGVILNEGKIDSQNGHVYLISREITNKGEIHAENGSVSLLSGTEVILANGLSSKVAVKVEGDGYINNEGMIKSTLIDLKANSNNIYALAINHSGIIDSCSTTDEKTKVVLDAQGGMINCQGSIKAIDKLKKSGGTIHLLGEWIDIKSGSNIDVSGDRAGGELLIGGDYQRKGNISLADTIIVENGASITADAIFYGNGGKVILWSDKAIKFDGSITAKGGCVAGDGGLVDISSKNLIEPRGAVNTLAKKGKHGSLLLNSEQDNILNIANKSWMTPYFLISSSDKNNSLSSTYQPKLKATNTIWSINGADAGDIDNILLFNNFNNIVGSALNDNFILQPTGSISQSIDGGLVGSNLLTKISGSNVWKITGTNAGSLEWVEGSTSYSTAFNLIQSLIGGSAVDTFIVSDAGSISGSVDAGGGSGNILDYSTCSPSTYILVDLQNNTATKISGDTINIDTFIGAGTNSKIKAEDVDNIWNISANNGGDIDNVNQVIIFSKFGNVTGGASNDRFLFGDAIEVTGMVDGGSISPKENILDYSNFTTPAVVDYDAGYASNLGGFVNIQKLEGNYIPTHIPVPSGANMEVRAHNITIVNVSLSDITKARNYLNPYYFVNYGFYRPKIEQVIYLDKEYKIINMINQNKY